MSTKEHTLRRVMRGDLVVHLKLDAIEASRKSGEKATVRDSSGNNNRATVHGSPELAPDERFGSCLRFNRSESNDYLELPSAGDILTAGWTFSTWIYLDPKEVRHNHLILRARADDSPCYAAVYTDGDGFLMLDSGGKELKSEHPVAHHRWVHVAVAVLADGSAWLWVDGRLVVEGQLQALPESMDWTVAVGSYKDASVGEQFSGKMAHVRLYGKALTVDEIQRQMSLDELTTLRFSVGSPLEFQLWDEQQDAAIYIEGGETAHGLTLVVRNKDADKRAVIFHKPDVSPLGSDRDHFFRRHHHLELRFPRGTISQKASARMQADLDGLLDGQAKTGSSGKDLWCIHYHEHKNLRSASIYLLCLEEKTLEAGDTANIEIVLPHIAADVNTKARVVPVELRPGPLAKRSDGALIVGPRMTRLNVVSQRGRKAIPLHFDIVGSDTVINDGSEPGTSLLLRITNMDQKESIRVDKSTQFIVACEIADKSGDQEWALTDERDKVQVHLLAAGKGPPKLDTLATADKHPDWAEVTSSPGTGRMVEWVIDGDHLGTNKLKPNDSVYLRIKVQTNLSSGPTDVHLCYRNIPGYWDGSRACTIQKSPLIFHHTGKDLDYVGIGTNEPASKLAVTDGLTVGADWAAKHAAPASGLLVEGRVSIGIETPSAMLHVGGDARVDGIINAPTALIDGMVYATDVKVYRKISAPEAEFTKITGALDGVNINNTSIALDKLVASVQQALCPVGTILPYAGDKAPAGWLMCDGLAYRRDWPPYKPLSDLIGKRFGIWIDTSDGAERFRVPDLRGRFLRGKDGGINRDPDRASRTAAWDGGATGDAVGSVQEDEFKSHAHKLPQTVYAGFDEGDDDESGRWGEVNSEWPVNGTDPFGGSETRPKNMYVNYIIKY